MLVVARFFCDENLILFFMVLRRFSENYIVKREKIGIYVASLFYAAGFSFPSVTVVVVDIASPPAESSEVHAKEGNLWKRAARYLGWLMPYTMGLYTAFAFAKRDPQIVKSGLILVVSKIPE